MKIEINIQNSHVLIILLFIIAASAIGLVVAYGGTEPWVMGHTWGEMICDNTLCANMVNSRVGIGTTSPQATLDVAGGIKIGSDITCNNQKAGTVHYSGNNMQYCDGTNWKNFLGGSRDCQIISVSFAGSYEGSANCPAGYRVTGGGGYCGGCEMLASEPASATRWYVYCYGICSGGNNVNAICCPE